MGKIEKLAEEIAIPIVSENGCELYDVEYVKEGPNWFLRVYIDNEKGVSTEDCENVSRTLSKALDLHDDTFQTQYFLEVSSPGLDRKLKKEKDFERYKGHEVELRLFKPKKVYCGILEDYRDKKIYLKTETETLEFEKSKLSVIKLNFKGESK